jgi:hypothetical protein
MSVVKASKMLDGLDERFDFDLDNFEISLDTTLDYASCYIEDVKTVGDGAGVEYTVIVAVPRDSDHWQMHEDIERNLNRYISELTAGTDYTGFVDVVGQHVYSYETPEDVDENCMLYRATITVVPFQNISPYGDYGIDFGTEEYMDHLTKGTPWPPEYDD